MTELFKELNNIPQANDYLEKNIYSKDEFNKPVQQSEISKIINSIQNSFDKINEMFGDSFDLASVSSILPLLLNSLSDKNISLIQKVMPKISNALDIMKDVKVPNYKDLTELGIKTNLNLKVYFSYQLTLFAANLFEIEVKEIFNFKEQHDDINLDYYKYNSNVWKEIMTKLNDKENKPQIAFTSESLGLLMNSLFGINWYIKNFTTDDYNLDSKDMIDDNHIFSKDKTNLEVIKEVNTKNIEESIINATNIDGLLQFIYDLFSGEADKESYKLLKTFKILFQVDDDITTGNTNLNFDKKVLKINRITLSFKLGDWSTNGKTENGGLNTFLSSIFDGVIKGLASGVDPDGGILDFLNSIGMGSEQLGGVASGLVSSVLTGIDMDHFFKTLVNQIKESLTNLTNWSFINDKLKEQVNNIITKVESFRATIASIVDSEASYTNKFLGYLVNTDLRKLMQVFGLENSLPVELPKISLKQIVDLQLTKTMKLSDLLRTGTKGLSYVIALLAKGVAPKLSNIANEFNNTSLTQNSEFKLVKGDSTLVKISDLVTGDLLLGEGDAQYTYLLALATKLFDENNNDIKVTIPGKKEFGLSKAKQFSSKDGAKWMLGLGVELEDATIDWYKFRENTILYSISTLWNDETRNLIKGIFAGIKEILKSLTEVFDDKQNKLYLEDLNYTHFNAKLISYDNISNYANDSKIPYKIYYKNASVNNTYVVKLIFSGTRKKAIEPKYHIEYFETK